jgi:4-amino-4-deoxy-L-arabinose transferase-like glycosyltransferase
VVRSLAARVAPGGRRPPAEESRFYRIAFSVTVLVGLALRCLWAVRYDQTHAPPGGDAFYYHAQANEVVKGLGFIDPFRYACFGIKAQSAAHPPLYTLYLAAFSMVGLKSTLAHRVVTAFAGAATVGLLGDAGRRMRGPRVGLVVAIITALTPTLWINDALLMSETVFATACAFTIWATVRYWQSHTRADATLVAVGIALATLARAEAIVFVVVLALPLFALAKPRVTARTLGIATLVFVVLLAPWTAYNLHRFEKPELISTGLGRLLVSANCDNAYYVQTGSWSFDCLARTYSGAPGSAAPAPGITRLRLLASAPHACRIFSGGGPPREESVEDVAFRKIATDYINHHKNRLLFVVVPARIGRTLEVYEPADGIRYQKSVEQRGTWQPGFARFVFYGLMIFTAIGAWVMRRRRAHLLPLFAMLASAIVTTLISYGNVRFRIALDVALPLYAAVGLLTVLDRVRRRPAPPDAPREPSEPAPDVSPARV